MPCVDQDAFRRFDTLPRRGEPLRGQVRCAFAFANRSRCAPLAPLSPATDATPRRGLARSTRYPSRTGLAARWRRKMPLADVCNRPLVTSTLGSSESRERLRASSHLGSGGLGPPFAAVRRDGLPRDDRGRSTPGAAAFDAATSASAWTARTRWRGHRTGQCHPGAASSAARTIDSPSSDAPLRTSGPRGCWPRGRQRQVRLRRPSVTRSGFAEPRRLPSTSASTPRHAESQPATGLAV